MTTMYQYCCINTLPPSVSKPEPKSLDKLNHIASMYKTQNHHSLSSMPTPPHLNSPKLKYFTTIFIPFWISILFITLIYFSKHYFNEFLPNLFNTTKFWFLISNIIILVILADFGSFCSSSNHDRCEETFSNEEINQASNLSIVEWQSPRLAESVHSKPVVDQFQEVKVKDIVVYEKCKSSEYTTKNSNDIIVRHELRKNKHNRNDVPIRVQEFAGHVPRITDAATAFKDNKNEKKIDTDAANDFKDKKNDKKINVLRRSKTEEIDAEDTDAAKDFTDKKNEKKINVLRRSKTEEIDAEENEFSRMSDEELNIRVEEFIKKFSRQIQEDSKRFNESSLIFV